MRSFTRSITWKLQFWHALILLCVVAGLSTAWYLQTRRARLSEIDATLLAGARVLDGSLRGIRLPPIDGENEEAVALSENNRRRLSLPRDSYRDEDSRLPTYFAIWLKGGRLLRESQIPESVVYAPLLNGQKPVFTQRGDDRDVRIVGPSGTQILVGRNISPELRALHQLVVQIVAISVAILIVGLLGGFWLSRSVLRPLQVMSDTAAQFSVKDMSPRIDVGETESELGRLASILNDAFDRAESSFVQQQQFAADASHELRTPLAVIQSQIELALKKPRPSEEYVKALTICSTAEQRLNQLVESLLTLAKLDSADKQLNSETLRLDQIAAKCTDLVRPIAEQAEVSIESRFEPVTISGRRDQLERAILNLLKNGITYNRSEGTISVSTSLVDGEVILEVSDTGIGICQEDLLQVTRRFFRVDPARSREQGGSGLGLSIVQQIVEGHGGTLQFTSEPGKGTTVRVVFSELG